MNLQWSLLQNSQTSVVIIRMIRINESVNRNNNPIHCSSCGLAV